MEGVGEKQAKLAAVAVLALRSGASNAEREEGDFIVSFGLID